MVCKFMDSCGWNTGCNVLLVCYLIVKISLLLWEAALVLQVKECKVPLWALLAEVCKEGMLLHFWG